MTSSSVYLMVSLFLLPSLPACLELTLPLPSFSPLASPKLLPVLSPWDLEGILDIICFSITINNNDRNKTAFLFFIFFSGVNYEYQLELNFRYLAAKSEADHYARELRREHEEIVSVPDTGFFFPFFSVVSEDHLINILI